MLTNDDKAILLLCSHIGIKDSSVKPLTTSKWNDIANKINKSDIKRPGNIFKFNEEDIKKQLELSQEELNNFMKLLSRSLEFSVDLERLNSKGIHIVTRASKEYPIKLKRKLKSMAPPILYYCGELSLINKDGIGIVGSRKIKEEHVVFTKDLVDKAISENLVIFSGGAKGIDDTSEKEAFLQGGAYVSFLSDSLESKIKKKEIRERLSSGRVLLITSSNPNAGFNIGLAMNRNKYIYASSSATFVIASDYKKGGTWAGATENMNVKHSWTRTFVKQDVKSKGIQELIKIGAIPIDDLNNLNLRDTISKNKIKEKEPTEKQFIESVEQIGLRDLIKNNKDTDDLDRMNQVSSKDLNTNLNNEQDKEIIQQDNNNEKINFDLYDVIIDTMLKALEKEHNIEELSEKLNVNKTQVGIWVKRSISEGKVKQLKRPVRYIKI
ncbi:DNA-processing protein DprA [Intestinibacter sp.]|uniref:DNA-processing protein DprA n=1 Tax=Intestinibacter sp. TaxID=1965304 RepID=UPI002A912AD3|nr:DNA-processing protein DprA [Intestinibacter sp.]MDY5213573.1 DNA-processing protein DprA [Intestinibacter sp.]